MQNQDSGYCYSFPAVRGIQAGRPFYIATCPLRIIPKIFSYNEDDVPPELRAQRTLNKTRIPEMVRYLLDNPKEYVFSALTASVGVDISFHDHEGAPNLGTLQIPMDAQILINDGQHRRKATEEADEPGRPDNQDVPPRGAGVHQNRRIGPRLGRFDHVIDLVESVGECVRKAFATGLFQ